LKINQKFKTNGKGLWSTSKVDVLVTELSVNKYNDKFGELKAFYNPQNWDIQNQGLIYTDPNWLKELKEHLKTKGFTDSEVNDISYSEQGMQGDDFVSMDIGGDFLNKWSQIK
jgi:hypothetical protein